VVDPSERMVHLAAQHQGVSAVRGLSQALPFREGSVSLVYFHLSIHYGDWRLSLREARRVLASGGRCVVWTLGPEHHRRSMLARWFPSVAAIDTERFPFPAAVVDELAAIGFSVDKGFEVEEVRKPAADWSSAVEAGFVSTLQLISADEKQAGLRAFGASYPDPAQPVSYEMRWDRIVGTTSAD
jgi:SAM-dependent methyltransferase